MNAVPEIMEPTSFDGLEDRFGRPFVSALRNTLESGVEETDAVQVWGRAMAKDQFSKVVTRALDGKCQIVRTRSKDPVLVMSLQHLATFVGQAATLRRFASMIIQEPEGEFGRRFGAQFIVALRRMMDVDDEEPVEFKPWGIAEAKGHFREMLDRAIQGECQLVRRRSSEPVRYWRLSHSWPLLYNKRPRSDLQI